MRSIKELYNILLEDSKENIKNNYYTWEWGICNWIYALKSRGIIDMEEYNSLYKHFRKQYPKPWSKFFWTKDTEQITLFSSWLFNDPGGYWFIPKNNEIRIKFIESIIKKL